MLDDIPILLASGEQAGELAARFTNDHCTGVIAMPYDAANLMSVLQTLGLKCRMNSPATLGREPINRIPKTARF